MPFHIFSWGGWAPKFEMSTSRISNFQVTWFCHSDKESGNCPTVISNTCRAGHRIGQVRKDFPLQPSHDDAWARMTIPMLLSLPHLKSVHPSRAANFASTVFVSLEVSMECTRTST